MTRHEARQKALQALYQMDVGKADANQAVNYVLDEAPGLTDKDLAFVRELVFGTSEHLLEIDDLLEGNMENWRVDRVARTDLNSLRLAIYELLYEPGTDVGTIVDEAVELAKSFGTDESGRFVNGVLAKVLRAIPSRQG